MAKKSRRVRKKGRQVRLSSTQMVLPEGIEAASSSFATAAARSAPKVSDLREEYRYVIADLKRIGIIAVAMLAVLMVLALVLT